MENSWVYISLSPKFSSKETCFLYDCNLFPVPPFIFQAKGRKKYLCFFLLLRSGWYFIPLFTWLIFLDFFVSRRKVLEFVILACVFVTRIRKVILATLCENFLLLITSKYDIIFLDILFHNNSISGFYLCYNCLRLFVFNCNP